MGFSILYSQMNIQAEPLGPHPLQNSNFTNQELWNHNDQPMGMNGWLMHMYKHEDMQMVL